MNVAIEDGIGVGDFKLTTSTPESLKAIYGEPDLTTNNSKLNGNPPNFHYNSIGVVFKKGAEGTNFNWIGVIFQSPYQGRTKQGIGVGDSRTKVLTAYGTSDDVSNDVEVTALMIVLELGNVKVGQVVSYKNKGILFVFDDIFSGNVELIIIFDPR